MLDIDSRHMYAPTPATAGLSCSHHHTHVVLNHTEVIPITTVNDATKAHGASPPVNKRPPRKNLLRDCDWVQFRMAFPVFGSIFGVSASGKFTLVGGIGLNISCREVDEAPGCAELFL